MRHAMRRLAGTAAVALASSLLLAPAASAGPVYTPFPEGKDPGVSLAAQPLVGVRIAIDPGHNGARAEDPEAANRPVVNGRGDRTACNTTGTASPHGYTEHEFAFEVSTQLADELESLGAVALMTRTDDSGIGPCVDQRGTFAEDNDVDLMVSIHAASEDSDDAPGFLVAVADPPLSPSQRVPSHQLAESLVAALEDADFSPSEGVEDPVVSRSDDATLNFARRPTVLVELGDLRNRDDAQLMRSEDGQERYVQAVTAGVLSWVEANR